MPNTVIQIKRSVSNSVVSGLAPGELAFTANGYGVDTGVLYIGNPNGNGVSVIGGTYNPGVLTNYQALVANSTGGIDHVIVSNLSVTSIQANGVYGTAGLVLTSNASGGVYWDVANTSDLADGTVTSIGIGNGLTSTQSPLTTNGTISVLAGNGVSVDANGVSVVACSAFTVNTSGLYLNSTAAVSLGSLTLSGNLIVEGVTTTLNTATLQVEDNFIQLADQEASTNAFVDSVDSGLFIETGNTSVNFYSGIARIASLSSNTNPHFKLFSTNLAVNTSTIDTSASVGTLQAFLNSGAFVSNSSAVALTANSTVSVNIVGNTLSLSTALPATSGGTGFDYTVPGSLLVGNTGNTWSQLGIGADGTVLQVSGNSVVYAMIDGGSF